MNRRRILFLQKNNEPEQSTRKDNQQERLELEKFLNSKLWRFKWKD